MGAKISDYLLEMSRIVSQANDERNYHVFYELLAGLDPEEKVKYGLLEANKYFYLNQGQNCSIEHKDDKADFRSLISAIETLGFSKAEQDTIFRMLASVLHIGNIYFLRKQVSLAALGRLPSLYLARNHLYLSYKILTIKGKNYNDTVEIGSEGEIKWVSHLLTLNEQGLRQKLTHKITEARGEKVFSPFNIDQALDARDAIAKALYSRLFSWLVERMNEKMICRREHKDNSIAILDIFGFEVCAPLVSKRKSAGLI